MHTDRRDEKDILNEMACRKKPKLNHDISDLFDSLPDDIVVSILARLSSTAPSPSDFISVLLTCTRLNRLGLHPLVLRDVGMNTVAVRAKSWTDSADRFLRQCVRAGSNEASYFLGMIRFYCFENRRSGASLMAKAALRNHVPSLYSLAVIQFNGSGGSKDHKDLTAGCALCARAADLGHIDALRELGHCFQDGYGVRKNITQGRSLLIQATAIEVACAIRSSPKRLTCESQLKTVMSLKTVPSANPCLGQAYWTDFGLQLTPREKHPANRFLIQWFELKGMGRVDGLGLCSDLNCGRPETRVNEFRRCSGCGKVNYCSRGCQAHDWKVRHKMECSPMPQLVAYNTVDVDLIP